MFRRVLVAAAIALAVFAGQANAQGRVELRPVDFTSALLTKPSAVRIADLEQFPAPVQPVAIRHAGSSAFLKSLYVSTVVIEALDVHSTLQAFRRGAVEANPMMKGIASNRAAFVAVKAAVAASTILAARQIAKRSKLGAVVTMVAINSAYAMVVQRNYSLARAR